MRDSLLISARFLNFFFPLQTSFRISLRSNSCSPERKEGKGCLTKAAFSHTTCQSCQQKKWWKQVHESLLILHKMGIQGRMPTWTTERSFQDRGATFFLNHDGFSPLKRQRERERLKQALEKKRGAGRREVGSFVGIYSETSKENARVTKAKILVWLSCTAEKDLPPGNLFFIPRPSPFYLGSENLRWISRAGELRRRTQRKNITQSRNRRQFSLVRCDDSLTPSAEGGKRRNNVMTRETRPMEKMGDFLIGLYF